MTSTAQNSAVVRLDPAKFQNPDVTLDGQRRASVELKQFHTLWFNTGTLCNLTCTNCYIESSPSNDRLAYLSLDDVATMLDELDQDWQAQEIGFTGGEPFMNPEFIAMLENALARGYRALVLTNAMRPMMKQADALLALKERFGDKLAVRVSIDHYTEQLHNLERGKHAWSRMLPGLKWLAANGFNLDVSGRTQWAEPEGKLRAGYARMFAEHGIGIDARNPQHLVLFPEMDETVDVPEITTACWGILDVSPDAMMCASSRMVVKRKGESKVGIVACTLLPYDDEFEMGGTLAEAAKLVKLNHPHCARFCVLGGGACSVG